MASAVAMSDLTVTIDSSTSIILHWNDYMTDERGYVLEKKVDSGEFYQYIGLSANATYCYDFVEAGKTYTYRIRVNDYYNNSYMYTNELTFRTDELTKPNSLKITPVSYNQIDLEWTYPNQKSYNTIIERRAENDTKWYQLATVGIGQNTFSDKTISSGVRYYYKVSAYSTNAVRTTAYPDDTIGSSSYSLLYKPTDLCGFALSTYQIQLNWVDNSVETAFIVERKSSDEGIFKEIAVVPQNKTVYIDTLALPSSNAIYTYRVKAVSGSTSSEYSNIISVTSTYLRAPEKLSAVCLDEKSIKITWNDLTDTETGFEIWRKTGFDSEYTLYETMGRNANSFTDLSVSPGDTYSYKVRAKINDHTVYSSFTNETTIWASKISSPQNLNYNVLSQTQVQLSWEDTSTVETGFKVERKLGAAGQWYEIANLEPNTTTYIDKWINNSDIYFYRVKTFDVSNAINYSNEIVVWLKTPETPTNLQAKALSSSEIELTWEDNSSTESEFVIEAMQDYFYYEIGRVNADTTAFTYKNISPNTKLVFRVKAVRDSNKSSYSNEATATTKRNVTYSDLSNVKWAVTAINNLASRNVFDWAANSKFYPQQNITRGEFCAIIIRSLELSKIPAGRFDDVTSTHKYYKEIMSASKQGIIFSDANNKIYPNRLITREQAGVMLSLALKVKGTPLPEENTSILKQFADYRSISNSSAKNIAAVCGAGILSGRSIEGRTYLLPASYLTRAEAAVLAYKAINFK